MANLRAWIEGNRVRYRDARGKKITAGRHEDKQFLKVLLKKTQLSLDNAVLGRADTSLTAVECFQKFIKEYAQEHEQNTLDTMQGDVKPLLSRIERIVDATPEFMKEYKSDLIEGKGFSKPLARATVYRYLGSAKTFLFWAKTNKFINWNPFENVTNPQPKSTARFLSDIELSKCEEASSERFLPLFRLCWTAGLRQGEAFDALAEDLTRNGDGSGSLLLRDTKDSSDRVVPIPLETMNILPSHRSGKLLPGWSYTVLKNEWSATKKRAQLDGKCGFHATRHTFAKKYLEDGGQETALMRILGHSSLQMIAKVYGHFAHAHLSRSVRHITHGVKLAKVANLINLPGANADLGPSL